MTTVWIVLSGVGALVFVALAVFGAASLAWTIYLSRSLD